MKRLRALGGDAKPIAVALDFSKTWVKHCLKVGGWQLRTPPLRSKTLHDLADWLAEWLWTPSGNCKCATFIVEWPGEISPSFRQQFSFHYLPLS